MGEMSLSGLEKMQGEANKKFTESYDAAQKASEKAAAAEEAFYKAAQDNAMLEDAITEYSSDAERMYNHNYLKKMA